MPLTVLFWQRPPAAVGQPHFPCFHAPTVHPGSPAHLSTTSVCDRADVGEGAWQAAPGAPRARGQYSQRISWMCTLSKRGGEVVGGVQGRSPAFMGG